MNQREVTFTATSFFTYKIGILYSQKVVYYYRFLKEDEMNREFYLLKDYDSVPSIRDNIDLNEHTFQRITLVQNVIEANNYISRQLDLPLASKLLFINSLIVIDEVPRCIEKIYASLAEVRGLETYDYSDMSFYAILNREKGITRLFIREEVKIVEADDQERELLKLEDDDREIMLIKGTAISENEKPLAYYETVSDTGLYRYRSVTSYE